MYIDVWFIVVANIVTNVDISMFTKCFDSEWCLKIHELSGWMYDDDWFWNIDALLIVEWVKMS